MKKTIATLALALSAALGGCEEKRKPLEKPDIHASIEAEREYCKRLQEHFKPHRDYPMSPARMDAYCISRPDKPEPCNRCEIMQKVHRYFPD